MSILNFLKKIKLPSFEDEFIVDSVDQVSPEHEQRMRVLATMHRDKVLADKTVQARQLELEEMMKENWELHSDPSDGAGLAVSDLWPHLDE